MIWRALMVWVGILILAVLNGGARLAWLIPYFGETAGRALSTIALCALVMRGSMAHDWLDAATRNTGEALGMGLLWVVLTLAFEFLAGHYLFTSPGPCCWQDYDLSRGRISGVALVVVLFAPLWGMRLRTMKPG